VRHLVVVLAVIPCRGHEQHARGLRALDGHAQRGVGAAAAPRAAQDLGTVRNGVIDGLHGVGRPPRTVPAEELQRHEPRAAPGHARDAAPVVAHARDDACAVCAVRLLVHGVTRVGRKVHAMHVVGVAVAVVVKAVVRNFPRVHPHVLPEVLVCVINAGVNDGHGDPTAEFASERPPRLGRVYVFVGLVVQSPEGREVCVVGEALSRPPEQLQAELRPVVLVPPVGAQAAVKLEGKVPSPARLQ